MNKQQNLRDAFAAAEKLGIPPIIEVALCLHCRPWCSYMYQQYVLYACTMCTYNFFMISFLFMGKVDDLLSAGAARKKKDNKENIENVEGLIIQYVSSYYHHFAPKVRTYLL